MKKLKELMRSYEGVLLWKNNACKALTQYYCKKSNDPTFEIVDGKMRLTRLARAHYNEVLRLSTRDIFCLLVEMEEDIALCESIEQQVNEIVGNHEKR